MASKAELVKEAEELGLDPSGMVKADIQEMIDNFKALEVETDDLGLPLEEGDVPEPVEESVEEAEESKEVEEIDFDIEKLATQEVISLIVAYRNSCGKKGGDALLKIVRESVK